MKLADLFSKRAEADWESVSSPVRRLLSLLLLGAVCDQAEAVGFGFLADTPLHAEFQAWCAQLDEKSRRVNVDDPANAAAGKNAGIAGPAGLSHLPAWTLKGGVVSLHSTVIPIAFYPELLQAARESLVSIGGTEESPQPMRFIEYFPVEGGGAAGEKERTFVEVDFEIRRDNSFWILIRGRRTVDGSVNVSGYYF